MNKVYLSRSQSRTWAMDNPIGDPAGGPAYGEFQDVSSVLNLGGSVLGGILQSNASDKAADIQENAANQANQTQRYMYDTTRADSAPFLANGTAASNKLASLLGIVPTSGPGSMVHTYTTNDLIDTSGGDWKPNATLYAASPEYKKAWGDFISSHQAAYGVNPNSQRGSILGVAQQQILGDGFNLDKYNQDTLKKAQSDAQSDPSFGALLRKFGADDLNNDVVYKTGLQFGLDEGNKGIERQAQASGSMLSGATLKALAKYATDYAGTKAGEAYNRFTNDQTNTYNRIAGVAGAGQTATAQVGNAGQNYANNVSQNQIGVGNARAASAIGSANAWSGAINGGFNAYQQNQLLKSMNNGGQWWNSATGINANGGGF